MKNLPSLRLMIGFEAAARLNNYSRAAEELNLSQSAISHQILQLESQIGQTLFRRKGRGVELTVAGKLLYESVVRSLDIISNGVNRIETYLNSNLVTIVCPAPFAQGWLQPQLSKLRLVFPSLVPLISTDETARYIDEVDVDIVIGTRALQQKGVQEHLLFKDELVAVCAPSYPNPGLTAAAGLLMLEQDMMGEVIGPHMRSHYAHVPTVAIYDDQRLLVDAAIRNMGVAVVKRTSVVDALQSGRLTQLEDFKPISMGEIWISRAEGAPRVALIQDVYDGLLAQANAQSV
ncbi:MAG: LysR family transcriptional regulator [Burkholderiaceae bacterium]|jgi:LysR family glycine cleavage system transcriptional activator|nr:LysR family transcriptional regulator [Burkholderiaceae bacterium]